ncbi:MULTISPECIES: hypothetical protein [unclassified Microbacterium]|uniref:hypothetical protein n=1 Tax=unclassified Microbacterium TaxID=2609290 RepID=UPI000EA94A26|nr:MULTISPECIES: hypothetical protein [unclassified Microbacterium]MBT2484750.1 hypothetical protein [Microbacterium sp. ISL-108]RKN67629.1 hypothetical protein D7252_08570 [Microbacterium sp. CGR2]
MNPGIAPLDPNTAVGQLRALVGDTQFEPLAPPVDGQGDYYVWSDAALEAVLIPQAGNVLRAAGHLYLQLAAEYAQSQRSIKTDDLAINTIGRGDTLLKVAQSFFDEATAGENAAASDSFLIISPGGRRGRGRCACRPEGTPRPLDCFHSC